MIITIDLETIIMFSMITLFVMALWFHSVCRKMDDVLSCYGAIHKQMANLILKTWICMGWFGAIIGGLAVSVFINN